MKPLKFLFAATFFTILMFACRKKDCPTPVPLKTDELSNTTWLGAYGRNYSGYRQLDTLIALAFKPDGFINVYEKDTTTGLKGKGFYTFDGKNFKATISFFRVGSPYIFEGILSEKIVLLGSIVYNAANTDGAFEIVRITPL